MYGGETHPKRFDSRVRETPVCAFASSCISAEREKPLCRVLPFENLGSVRSVRYLVGTQEGIVQTEEAPSVTGRGHHLSSGSPFPVGKGARGLGRVYFAGSCLLSSPTATRSHKREKMFVFITT